MLWRKNILVLSDEDFLNLMRMYLGEIKTPYNKQNLLTDLGNFIADQENKKNIVNYLSEKDLAVLSAVKFIPNPTPEKIRLFFNSFWNNREIDYHVQNLKDRLVIFEQSVFDDPESEKKNSVLSINPILEEDVTPYLSQSRLVSDRKESGAQENVRISKTSMLNPLDIIAFICFVLDNPDMYKNEGSFKIRIKKNIDQIFDVNKTYGQLDGLAKAFTNLGLFYETQEGLKPDWENMKAFGKLTNQQQICYVCASSYGMISRKSCTKYAQVLMTLLLNFGNQPLGKDQILRQAFLILENNDKKSRTGRSAFQRLIQEAEQVQNNSTSVERLEILVDSAIEFGLLCSLQDDDRKDFYVPNPDFEQVIPTHSDQKFVNVNPNFSVVIFPGLSFDQLLPFTKFLSIVKYDTAVSFELTRKSAVRGFSLKLTDEMMCQYLSLNSVAPIHQSIPITLQDWRSCFSSMQIYRGFIMRLDEGAKQEVLKNPVLSTYLGEEIAPGIFVLNVEDDDQLKVLMEKSGYGSSMDYVNSFQNKTSGFFESLDDSRHRISDEFDTSSLKEQKQVLTGSSFEDRKLFAERMTEVLDDLKITDEQKECLVERICKKIVVSPKQLNSGSVRFEIGSAGPMDFAGKVHLVEGAIESVSKISIEMLESETPMTGIPKEIKKSSEGTEIVLLLDDGTEQSIDVGSAGRIRKIRLNEFRD